MTSPEPGSGDGVSAQLLLKISNDVSGLVTDMAVLKEQTRALSDHEQRIRELRAEVPTDLVKRLGELESQAAQSQGGRDVSARVTGGVGILAAIGATVANYLHH